MIFFLFLIFVTLLSPTSHFAELWVIKTERDTFVSEGHPNSSFGQESLIEVTAEETAYGLIKFNLAPLPQNGTVQSAWLELWCVERKLNSSVALYEFRKSWQENDTFNSLNIQDSDIGPLLNSVSPTLNYWVRWSVPAALVQSWLTTPNNNHGLLLKELNSSDTFFLSSEYHQKHFRPRLIVNLSSAHNLRITIDQPQGGEDWTGGEEQKFIFTIQGGTPYYELLWYLSEDNGQSYKFWWRVQTNGAATFQASRSFSREINSNQCLLKCEVIDSENLLASFIMPRSFEIDSTPPTILARTPAPNETEVPLQTPITIHFSEPMAKEATQFAFSLSSPQVGPLENLTYHWSNNDTILTITHTGFTRETTYHCIFSPEARDSSEPGNHLEATSWHFITESYPPITGNILSPNPGAIWTGDSEQTLLWQVGGGKPPYEINLSYLNTSGEYIFIKHISQTSPGQLSTIWHLPREDITSSRIKLEVTDARGRVENIVSQQFRIIATSPQVLSVFPAPEAEEVAFEEVIRITFSQPMNTTAVEANFNITPTLPQLSFSWSPNAEVLSITHSPFTPATTYECLLARGAKDASVPGNYLRAPFSWKFTSKVLPLEVALLTPEGDEFLTAGISFLITWRINHGKLPYRVKLSWSSQPTGDFHLLKEITQTAAGENSYLWNIPSNLNSETVRIKLGVTDARGQQKDIISENFTVDALPPRVVELQPEDGADDVSLNTTIRVVFSESMERTATEDSFRITPAVACSFSWQDGRTLIITPSGLRLNTHYECRIRGKDLSQPGNPALPMSWSFTTQPPPLNLTLLTPTGGENFSGGALHPITWRLSGGREPYQISIYYSLSPNEPDVFSTLFSQKNAGENSLLWEVPKIRDTLVARIKLLVQDKRGKQLEVISPEFGIDVTPPQVIRVQPVGEEIPLNTAIEIEFSEPMNQQATINAFSILPLVSGLKYDFNEERTILRIEHNGFKSYTLYQCSIQKGARDRSLPGNRLEVFEWSFRSKSLPLVLLIKKPVGGECFSGYSSQELHWELEGGITPYYIKLLYSTDNGVSFKPMGELKQSSPGRASFIWQLPSGVNTEEAKIKIIASDNLREVTAESERFAIDSTVPTIIKVKPEQGEKEVPPEMPIEITFSEPMAQASIQEAFQISPPLQELNFSWTEEGKKLKITHSPFNFATHYTVTIEPGTHDCSEPGNLLPPYQWSFTTAPEGPLTLRIISPRGGEVWSGLTSHTLSWRAEGGKLPYRLRFYHNAEVLGEHHQISAGEDNFRWLTPNRNLSTIRINFVLQDALEEEVSVLAPPITIDAEAPRIVKIEPADGQENVELTQVIKVYFSEPIVASSLKQAFQLSPEVEELAFSYDEEERVLSITHSGFRYFTSYQCSLDSSICDLSIPGNKLLKTTWQFTTRPQSYIEISIIEPGGGEIFGGGSRQIITCQITGHTTHYFLTLLYSLDGGLNYQPIIESFEIVKSTPPQYPFSFEYSYPWQVPMVDSQLVRIQAVIEDQYRHKASANSRLFTLDATPPRVIQVEPAENAQDVALNTPIRIFFSEPIAAGFKKRPKCLTITPYLKVSWTWSSDERSLLLWHNGFKKAQQYEIQIKELPDYATPPNFLTEYHWSFSTRSASPFSLKLLSPKENSVWTGNTSHEILWELSGEEEIFNLEAAFSTDNGLTYTSIFQKEGVTLGKGSFRWAVPRIDCKDVLIKLTAQTLLGVKESIYTRFGIDSSPPKVRSTLPQQDAVEVSPSQSILINFSEPMSQESITAFSITPALKEIKFEWLDKNKLLRITHSNFSLGKKYYCQLRGARDASQPGNILPEYSWSFTIRAIPENVRGKTFVYPNPARVGTKLTFCYPVAKPGKVTIRLYNLVYKQVAWFTREHPEVGQQTAEVNISLAPGVYFYHITLKPLDKGKSLTLPPGKVSIIR